ncbi:MAG TPA: hypothetical protein VIW46_02640 [Acidimicrobiia bacterium]|jgi:hypothetical protein
MSSDQVDPRALRSVVALSLLLLFFAIPHTLEDFATGEPAEAGVPAGVLSLVVAFVFFVQALGLYWLGQGRRRGLIAHLAIGLFWPVASGFAQVPAILEDGTYREGTLSVMYVAGLIVIGVLLVLSTWRAFRKRDPSPS